MLSPTTLTRAAVIRSLILCGGCFGLGLKFLGLGFGPAIFLSSLFY